MKIGNIKAYLYLIMGKVYFYPLKLKKEGMEKGRGNRAIRRGRGMAMKENTGEKDREKEEEDKVFVSLD